MDTIDQVITYTEFQLERVVPRIEQRMLTIANLAKDRICAQDNWWFMDTERSLSTTSGEPEYDKPTRFIGLGRRAWWVDDNNEIHEIDIKTHSEVRLRYPTDETGEPKYLYYNYEDEKLTLAPIPDDTYSVYYDAIIKLADLSLGEGSVLTIQFPYVLVAGMLAEIHFSLRDLAQYGLCEDLFKGRMKDITRADARIKAERARVHLSMRTGARASSLASTWRERRL